MTVCLRRHIVGLAAIAIGCWCASSAMAETLPAITAGFDFSAPRSVLDIPSIFGTVPLPPYTVDADLTFDPSAGWITKNFGTPRSATGAPLQLSGSELIPFVINETFSLSDQRSRPISDWHERFELVKGWEWVVPGDARFPTLFPQGQTLITRDGQPWPSTPVPGDGVDVVFAPITTGHVLDVHKAIVWVGTETNPIWGDDPSETTIIISEYPTPEPSSLVLAAVGALALALACKGSRRR